MRLTEERTALEGNNQPPSRGVKLGRMDEHLRAYSQRRDINAEFESTTRAASAYRDAVNG